MQRQHSSQATSTLGNTPNLNIGFLHQKENPTHTSKQGLRFSIRVRVSLQFTEKKEATNLACQH